MHTDLQTVHEINAQNRKGTLTCPPNQKGTLTCPSMPSPTTSPPIYSSTAYTQNVQSYCFTKSWTHAGVWRSDHFVSCIDLAQSRPRPFSVQVLGDYWAPSPMQCSLFLSCRAFIQLQYIGYSRCCCLSYGPQPLLCSPPTLLQSVMDGSLRASETYDFCEPVIINVHNIGSI